MTPCQWSGQDLRFCACYLRRGVLASWHWGVWYPVPPAHCREGPAAPSVPLDFQSGRPAPNATGLSDALATWHCSQSCTEENMKKQTTGQVHFGFNKCPSVGNVHFAPKPLDRGKRCLFTTAPLLTLGRADSGRANCNKGGTLHRRGLGAPSSVAGELLSHLGLGHTVSPGNVFRAECDARRNFTLTDLLHWFNKLYFAAETLLHMASYSCLQSINRCRGAKTCEATRQNPRPLGD